MEAGRCVFAATFLQVHVCFPHILTCVSWRESILGFDVGSGDGGDGRSQERVVPEGRIVRGEEDREGGGQLNGGKNLC